MSILEIKNLSYKYGVGTPFEIAAIDNINLSIEKGEMVAIIGHTGSGKSTLIQHFKHTNLTCWPKTIFNGTHNTIQEAFIPFKIQYGIHHVL